MIKKVFLLLVLISIYHFAILHAEELNNTVYLVGSVLYPTATGNINGSKTKNSWELDYERDFYNPYYGEFRVGGYKINNKYTVIGLLSNSINEEDLRVNFFEFGFGYKKTYNRYSFLLGPGLGIYISKYNYSKDSVFFGNLEEFSGDRTSFSYYIALVNRYSISKNITFKLGIKKSWANVSYSQNERKWTIKGDNIEDVGGIFVNFGIGYNF